MIFRDISANIVPMKFKLVIIFLLLSNSAYTQDIFGSWIYLGYHMDKSANLLDAISIIEIDNSKAVIQHSSLLKKEYNYIVTAEIVDNEILFVDPRTSWNMVLILSSNGRLLTLHPDFDDEFVKQYRRADLRYYDFLTNIDDFIENSKYLEKSDL